MAAHADVVGMTIASECIVAGELGLAYAARLRRRQPRQRDRHRLAGARSSSKRTRAANALLLHDGLAAVLPRLGAVGR